MSSFEIADANALGGEGSVATPQPSRAARTTTPTWPMGALAGVPAIAAASALSLTHHSVWPWVAVVLWAMVIAVQGPATPSIPGGSLLAGDLRTTMWLSAAAGLAALAGFVTPREGREVVLTTVVIGVSVMALRHLLPRPAEPRRVVLVGGRAEIEGFIEHGSDDRLVSGCLLVEGGDQTSVAPSLSVPTTTSVDTLPDLLASVEAEDVLVLPGAAVDIHLVRRLSWAVEHARVTLGVLHPVAAVSPHRLRTHVSRDGTVLELGAPRVTWVSHLAKRLIDQLGAAALLLVLSPLFAVLWLVVRLDSKGAGLFVQTRVGHRGRPFRMVKFRTMHVDAESRLISLVEQNESDGVLFKIRRDPRVTRVGYWLRRSSFDELPQLINVLRGEMSLVGPRPALPAEVSAYDDVARRRLLVKPGITGLWQVSGRSDLSWDESVLLDLYYADNWRLRDDFTIAARTVAAVIRARGAY